MTTAIHPDVTIATLSEDLVALKRDVNTLVEHLQRDAVKGAHNAAAQLDDGAHRVYKSLAGSGERSVREIGRQVEEQPVIALLLAIGVGYLGGRLLSR